MNFTQRLRRYGWLAAVVVGGSLLSASGAFTRQYTPFAVAHDQLDWRGLMLMMGVPLTALGGFQQHAQQRRLNDDNKQLVAKLTTAEQRQAELQEQYDVAVSAVATLGESAMMRLATTLKFTERERASLFIGSDGHLRLVGRYSLAQSQNAPGRGTFPVDFGCIGQAWETGEHEHVGLPDPKADWSGYRRALRRRYGIKAADAKTLTMPSRSYAAKRLVDSTGAALGVVLIESLQPRGVRLAKLKAYLDIAHEHELVQALNMSRLVPTGADVAKGAGF